ncbi:hypothetical protein BA022_08555 [Diaphorobacter nitroreducens]|uniref:hypothetical protein n=1 Tax=Diaphorobacter nitroreducens TaxID=164759 RepID=UPI000B599E0A|nr:hypothetical protein [Diaphorobacter nitroreducens]ASI68604.1 hypothetical protein BA022_08555 [Diaphorobacter nitroreducens]
MTAQSQEASPAYSVTPDGTVRINAAGAALEVQYADISAQFGKLQHNWTQAEIAALFVRHPSVRSFDLRLSSSWEYDDSGGCYLSGSCTIDNVCLDPASAQIGEFLEGQAPDTGLAAEVLERELDDTGHDLALVLLREEGSDALCLGCQREETLATLGWSATDSSPEPEPEVMAESKPPR